MRKNEVFPSRWLSHDDITGTHLDLTINRVGFAEFQDGTKKRAIWFREYDGKGLALNVTNWNAIADQTGIDDDDRWIGVKVRLIVQSVAFQGKSTRAIRVSKAKAPATPVPVAEPAAPDFDTLPDTFVDDSDSVPF